MFQALLKLFPKLLYDFVCECYVPLIAIVKFPIFSTETFRRRMSVCFCSQQLSSFPASSKLTKSIRRSHWRSSGLFSTNTSAFIRDLMYVMFRKCNFRNFSLHLSQMDVYRCRHLVLLVILWKTRLNMAVLFCYYRYSIAHHRDAVVDAVYLKRTSNNWGNLMPFQSQIDVSFLFAIQPWTICVRFGLMLGIIWFSRLSKKTS